MPLTAAAICLLAVAGCGGADDGESGQLVVSAAASLQQAFTDYAHAAGIDARQSFAGSDELAAQIRQGDQARRLRRRQHEAARPALRGGPGREAGRLRDQPAGAGGARGIARSRSIDDLTKPGTAIAIGDPEVPVGSYTREVLDRLPAEQAKAILANVRSEEPDVSGIVGKLTQGAVDAGFVYVTDVDGDRRSAEGDRAARRRCSPTSPTAPRSSRARSNPEGAQSFIDGLLRRRRGRGAAAGRLPAAAGLRRRAVRRPAVRRALRGAGVPDAADRRDLRRHLARRPDPQPRRARRPGCALAEPADLARRAGDHRGRRHARRLPAGDARVPRPRARGHADRAAAGPAARRSRGSRCSPRSGRRASSASALEDAGIELVLQTAGVVVALTFVAAPFYLRQAQAAFAAVDRDLLDAARTLGASEATRLRTRRGALRGPGISAGLALAWGRALGEFGATLMFAGSFQGITQTVPLAIFARFSTDFTAALALSAVLVVVSAALLLSVKLLGRSPLLGGGRAERARGSAPATASAGWSSTSTLRVEDRSVRGARRALGSRQDDRAADRRRAAAPRSRAGSRSAGRSGSTPSAASTCRPRNDACGFMFQEYALFPHLSAWQKRRLRDLRGQRGERRDRALELLERFGDRRAGRCERPDRSRAASASAWRWRGRWPAIRGCCCSTSRCRRSTPAPGPTPAASWSAALTGAGVPAILVTHDFAEAALLADEIGVIDRGRIVQRGTAAELSARPASAFVADFAGVGRADRDGSPRGPRADPGRAGRRRPAPQHRPGRGPGRRLRLSVGDRPRAGGRRAARLGSEPARGRGRLGRPRSATRVRVGLAAPQPLVAEVTAESTRSLGLRPGARAQRDLEGDRDAAGAALAADRAHRPRRRAEARPR